MFLFLQPQSFVFPTRLNPPHSCLPRADTAQGIGGFHVAGPNGCRSSYRFDRGKSAIGMRFNDALSDMRHSTTVREKNKGERRYWSGWKKPFGSSRPSKRNLARIHVLV